MRSEKKTAAAAAAAVLYIDCKKYNEHRAAIFRTEE
jgi:hypothetical protein